VSKSLRNRRTGGKALPVRTICQLRGLAALVALAAAPACLMAAAPAQANTAAAPLAGQTAADFYQARNQRPLWFSPEAGDSARVLLEQIRTADIDGLNPAKYGGAELDKALQKAWGGKASALRKADRLLSDAFIAYANDLRRVTGNDVHFVSPELAPRPQSPRALLEQAARASSLQRFVADMGWMNPVYGELRRALANGQYSDENQKRRLEINLSRARALPAREDRYIVVNTAAQRLYMYEGGQVADSMRVVVGQQKYATPMFASYVRYAALNPYWNVPPDLVGEDVGIYVKKYGLGYLKSRGYEVLSDWSDTAVPLDPATIDWDAVNEGKIEIRVRQKPGPRNVLGAVKYAIPNPFGVYLHDTSAKELLTKETRLFSGGCIRLEDAARLGQWLFGRKLEADSPRPDIEVALDRPVPVYVTYLTAMPTGSSIAWYDDVYGRDAPHLPGAGGAEVAAL